MNVESLRFIWWLLLGVLFMGYAVMDGFDLGAAILFPLIARDEAEKRIVLNTIGPVWEGNQVWIILGAGAIFAAWPYVYAVIFSGAYFAVLLLLLTMGISRPVSFKYRSKLPNDLWRRTWDTLVFIGGFVPAILFGILIGNILQGLPFTFDRNLQITYAGSFVELFNPFAWWCALTSVMMVVMHGGLFLAIKTNDPIRERALHYARMASLLLITTFAIGGVWVAMSLPGYIIVSGVNHLGFSNPMHKSVVLETGAWVHNYLRYPWTQALPLMGIFGALAAFITARWGVGRLAFICSSVSIIGVIGTVGVSMFPFILPSSLNANASLLVWDSSSTELTLLVMLFSAMIFLPLIFMYTAWVYRALSGKVDAGTLKRYEKDQAGY